MNGGADFFEEIRCGEGRPTNRWSFPFLDGTLEPVQLIPPGLCLSSRETLVARSAGRALKRGVCAVLFSDAPLTKVALGVGSTGWVGIGGRLGRVFRWWSLLYRWRLSRLLW